MQAGELDEFVEVGGLRSVVAEDLLLLVAEADAVGEGQRRRGQADEHQAAVGGEAAGGLLAHGGDAGRVEREVQAAPAGGGEDPLARVGVHGVDGDVGAEVECPLPSGRQGVDGDDGRGARQAQQLDGVGAEAADAPDPGGAGGPDPSGAGDGGPGGGDGVGDDRGLGEREVVGEGDEGVVGGQGVLGPAAVVVDAAGAQPGARFEEADAGGAASAALAGLEDDPLPHGPLGGDVGAEGVDDARDLVAEGDLVRRGEHGPEAAVDEVDVGQADAGGLDLDPDLAGARLGYRDLLEGETARAQIEPSGEHGAGHGGSLPESPV